MAANIKNEKEYIYKMLKKAIKPFYIIASLMIMVKIIKREVLALINSGAKIIIIIIKLA